MIVDLVSSHLKNRSGRIVALCRLVLALAFFASLWIDPMQPVRSVPQGYALLAGYSLFALAMAVIAWRSWWHDFRFARAAHVIDILAFLAAIFVTEGTVDEFTSPFLAFYAYLMLSATVRWGWQETVRTGFVVTILYLSVGLAMDGLGFEYDQFRFGRRVVYMAMLGLLLVWFGLQRQEPAIGRFMRTEDPARTAPPFEEALAYAVGQTGARAGVLAWQDEDEPLVEIFGHGSFEARRTLAPTGEDPASLFGPAPRMFDRRGNRAIVHSHGRALALPRNGDEPLAGAIGIDEGLAIPLATGTGQGELFLTGIGGAGSDHLEIGRLIGAEIAAAFDRHAAQALTRGAAVSRLRETLARDLHDSVAQSLAAASLQLEGLRRYIVEGGDPAPAFDALKRSLRNEQQQVRAMIGRLRAPEPFADTPAPEPGDDFACLAHELQDSWRVSVACRTDEAAATAPRLREQLRQIIREGVANAVRHGGARAIEISGAVSGRRLYLTIADDGSGFAPDWNGQPPRSIAERIAELGGNLAVDSTADGTVLVIDLDLEGNE